MDACRQAWRSLLRALAIAAALAVAGLAAAAVTASAARIPISAGAGLDWGLKESWRNYIGVGGTTISDGATRNLDGTFHFPVTGGHYDDATRTTTVQFGGRLVFLGHCEGAGGFYDRPCALDMTLQDPRVELTEDGGFLYARMESRPFEGGEVVELPDVRLAALDLDEVTPEVAGPTTTWSGLPATIAPEGSVVFTYGIGTLIDPVTFGYEGPGGKPLGEVWSEPNLATYEATPVADPAPAPTRLHQGFGTGLWVGDSQTRLSIVDSATLRPATPTAVVDFAAVRDTVAFDPRTRTVFAAQNGTTKHLAAFTWDGTTLGGGVVAGSEPAGLSGDPSNQGAGVWDAANRRYLVTRTYPTRQELWRISQVGGIWTAARIGTILGPNGQALRGAISSLAITPNTVQYGPAMIVATQWGGSRLLTIEVGDGYASAGPLDLGDFRLNANELFRTATGLYAFGDEGIAWFPVSGAGFSAMLNRPTLVSFPEGAPFHDLNRRLNWIGVDSARDTLFAVTSGYRRLTKIVRGVKQHTLAVPGVEQVEFNNHYLPGADAAGDPLLMSETAGTLTRLAYARLSPSFTTQAQDTAVALSELGTTRQATFSVAVRGDPAPSVRWQSRIPGLGRWADLSDRDGIAGAATTMLTTVVGEADHGRQYRAIATNDAGELASARATLDVRTIPSVAVAPVSVAVEEGAPALFRVMPNGNPDPAIVWQQRIGGFWREIDGDSGDFEVDGGALTVTDPHVAMTGTEFRARLRNEVGTVFTRPVTLTVAAALTQPVSFAGGHVDWGFAERWRCYVVGNVARGGIEVSGGATQVPGTQARGTLCAGREAGSESIRFPVRSGSFDPVSGRIELALDGSVRFWGHDHHVPGNPTPQLDTRFSNLRLVAEGASGTLYADASGATLEHPEPVTRTGVPLVRVDLTGASPAPFEGGLAWNGLATALTADGSAVFGSYPAGEAFDALALAPRFGTPAPVDPRPQPQPQPQPQPAPQPAPAPRPAPAPAPAPRTAAPAATVAPVRGVRTVGRTRVATLATLACPRAASGGCRVAVRRQVRVRIGGRPHTVRVLAPARVKAGARAHLRVRLTKAAATRLAGRRATVRLRVVTTVAGRRTASTLRVVVRGARR